MYTVNDVSKKLNMTPHTIRFYTDKGLVPNLTHDKNGNRVFVDESLNWLKACQFLRANNMSLNEIKHYFDLCTQGISTFEERYAILKDMEIKAINELNDLKLRVDCISKKVKHCEEIKRNICNDDCNPLNW